MVETQSQKKITNKTKSFHFRYLELCRSKNYAALSDVKAKNNNTTILEFFGDKLKIEDWLLIIDALYNDVALHSMAIRLRRTCNMGKYGFKGRSFDCGSVLTFAGYFLVSFQYWKEWIRRGRRVCIKINLLSSRSLSSAGWWKRFPIVLRTTKI